MQKLSQKSVIADCTVARGLYAFSRPAACDTPWTRRQKQIDPGGKCVGCIEARSSLRPIRRPTVLSYCLTTKLTCVRLAGVAQDQATAGATTNATAACAHSFLCRLSICEARCSGSARAVAVSEFTPDGFLSSLGFRAGLRAWTFDWYTRPLRTLSSKKIRSIGASSGVSRSSSHKIQQPPSAADIRAV